MTDLPIDSVLPRLCTAIAAHGRAVLVAPPGAGKTTRVPLALMDVVAGRIVMLEPRRLAARAAAERLAEGLGQKPGTDVGYRMRGQSVAGRRIEVVTEGILTRMIQSDPSLDGIGCVIFDEFHERSLNADLGLALLIEARAALRPDLAVLVMSATLDAEPVAGILDDAPVIRSEGRAFPVETRWLDRPLPAGARLVPEAARLIRHAEAETRDDPGGTILAFLPGEGEIRRVAAALSDLPADIMPLFGAMDFKAQRAVLSPPGATRRIVLATSIAETSLTIPGVKVVVDAGRARRARFDPGSGMSRLVTERVSRAEAEQRRGRAGRVAPGLCYRLWARAEEGALPGFAPPEITVADLTGLALELAAWGSDDLSFLTPPPDGALAEARTLLRDQGALDAQDRITDHGRALSDLPLHPRLGHMLTRAGGSAAELAALLADRDPLRGAPADLALRLDAIRDPGAFRARHPWDPDPAAIARLRDEAARLRKLAPAAPGMPAGAMAALAYPDRIGLRRKGDDPRYVLSGGKGARLEPDDPMAAEPLIVATDLDGDPRESRIRMAARITEAQIRALFSDRIETIELCEWDRREGRVRARRQDRLGALVLSDRIWDAPPEAMALAALDGLREDGLPWTASAARMRARIRLLGHDVGDEVLLADPDWLLPGLVGKRTRADLRGLDLTQPLLNRLGWDGQQQLDRIAPSHFTTPLGRRVPIDYDHDIPSIELRLQELFGVTRHPMTGNQPLRITLLSPGQKPIAVITDLPGFWAGSYADVRKDMRGRYPRHPWPEDPTEADPTLRAKPRGT